MSGKGSFDAAILFALTCLTVDDVGLRFSYS